MGDIYSKPEPGNAKPPGTLPPGGAQSARPRETGTNGSHHSGIDPLSGTTLEALSRIQGGNAQAMSVSNPSGARNAALSNQLYNSVAASRGSRNQDSTSNNAALSCALTNELLASAHLGGQFTAAQINALLAACQQQQQLQRSPGTAGNPHASSIQFAQALASASPGIKPPPASTPSLSSSGSGAGVVGGSSHTNRSLPSHLAQAAPLPSSHGPHQKRPPSGQPSFQSNHGAQSGLSALGGRPPSASQSAQSQRNPLTGQPGYSHLHHTIHNNPPHHSHLDQNATTVISGQNPLSGGRPQPAHHGQSGTTTSPSPGPVPVGYQGRRSQLAPPSTHSSKRARISSNVPASPQQQHHQHQQQHMLSQHGLSSLPATTHVVASTIASGMEAYINSVAASKAMATLNPSAGFLNPALYGSVSEAAAVAAAFSPLFTAAISGGSAATAPSPNNLGTFQASHYPGQQQRTPSTTSGNASAGEAPAIQQDQQHLLPPAAAYSNPLLTGSLLSSMNHARNTYPHITATTPAHNAQPTGSHQAGNHPSSSHIPAKAGHSANLLPMASRLPSGHLNHPHHYLASHPAPHSFHSPPHNVPQSGSTPHHLLPQGSGVLRQQTKEPAYHPQVEAISPAPEESRLADAQDAKIHREREELSRQLVNVEADLNKQRGHQRLLDEREARLTSRLASTGSSAKPVEPKAPGMDGQQSPKMNLVPTVDLTSDLERAYENPIQAFIAENRKRTRQHHLIFKRLCGPHVKAHPYALPLYRQPSDLPYLCAIRTDFRQRFRLKLVNYLRRRKKAEEARVKYLAQQYAHHSGIFTKKMEKLLNSTKQRHRELRYRDIFEKMHPEVKKNREDRELSLNDGVRPVVTEDIESSCQSSNGTLVDGTQTPVYDPVEEMNKMKEYAIDPPMPLAPWQRRYRFIYQAGQVTDCRAQLQEEHDISKWTDEEKQIFRERFLATPKNFPSIASYLEGKTVAECIQYYYLSKKTERYKQLLKKHNARRRRAVPADRGGGSGNNNSGGGSNSNQGFSAPPSSGSFQSGTLNGNLGSQPPPPNPGGGTGNGEPTNAASDTVRESDHQKLSGKPRDSTSGGRLRTGRGRLGTGVRQPTTTSADESLPMTTSSLITEAGKVQSCASEKVLEASESNSSALQIEEHLPPKPEDEQSNHLSAAKETDDGGDQSVRTSSSAHNADRDKSGIVDAERRPNSVQLRPNSVDSITNAHTLHTDTAPPASLPTVSSRGSPVTTLGSSPLSSSTDQGGLTCIKDLIHFAIEKNLTQPWTGRDGQLPSDSDRNTGLAHAPPKLPVCCTGNTVRQISSQTKPKTDTDSSTGADCLPCRRPAVDGTLELSKPGERVSNKLADHLNEQLSQHFPSTPAVDIYAMAAQLAAATGNSSELANAMYVAAAAAAAATAAVTGNTSGATSLTDHRVLELGSSLPTQFRHSPSPDNASHTGKKLHMNSSLSIERDPRQNHRLSQPPPATWTGPSSPTVSECNPSSKAILIGDFMTAQQLRTKDPTVAASMPVRLDRPGPPPSISHSRCIDPSTLPIPTGPSNSRSGPASLDRRTSRGGPPALRAEEPTSSLSAERAAWFAFHAQNAIAAAAAAAEAAARTEASSLTIGQPPVTQPSSPVVLPPLPRCTYSPLSPSPPKMDASGATGKLTPVSSSWQPQTNSAKFPDESSTSSVDPNAQIATFINNAQRRYYDEVELYAKRDRSDSMRTLTSSEASRFVGALQNVRQLHQQQQKENLNNPFDSTCNQTKPDGEPSYLAPKRPRSSEPIEDSSTTKRAHIAPGTKRLGSPSLEKIEPVIHDRSPSAQSPRIFIFDEPPDEIKADPQVAMSGNAFRRRGYTESQINRRLSLPEVPEVSSVPGDSNQLPNLSSQKDAAPTKGMNPATYIDALIHSHLNRSSTRSTNDSSRSTRPNPNLISHEFGARSGGKESSTQVTLSSDGDTAQQQHPSGFRRSRSSNTLEDQINKAIAEEIRAQIHPHSPTSPVSTNSMAHTIAASISSAVSPNNTTTESVASTGPVMPLKKRDRGCSLSALAHGSKLPVDVEPTNIPRRHSTPTDLSSGTGEHSSTKPVTPTPSSRPVDSNDGNNNKTEQDATATKWVTLHRPNGTRIPLDNHRILIKPAASEPKVSITPPNFWLPATSPNSTALSTSSVYTKNSTIKGRGTPQKPMTESHANPPLSPCSSVGDLDSPGSLHIDLAAADFQAPITNELESTARELQQQNDSSAINHSLAKDPPTGVINTGPAESGKPITNYSDHPPVQSELAV